MIMTVVLQNNLYALRPSISGHGLAFCQWKVVN